MPHERLPKQALFAKVKGMWDDQKHAGMTTLKILDGIAWDFTDLNCKIVI